MELAPGWKSHVLELASVTSVTPTRDEPPTPMAVTSCPDPHRSSIDHCGLSVSWPAAGMGGGGGDTSPLLGRDTWVLAVPWLFWNLPRGPCLGWRGSVAFFGAPTGGPCEGDVTRQAAAGMCHRLRAVSCWPGEGALHDLAPEPVEALWVGPAPGDSEASVLTRVHPGLSVL